MNKKKFTLLLIVFCFLTGMSYGQQEDKRVKIEITVKDGNKTIVAPVRTATFSFTTSANNSTATDGSEKKEQTKNYYFSIDFEKQNIELLKAFMTNKNGLDGAITVVDSYGKLPSRKLEFTKANIDSLSDQITADYTSAYMSIVCATLIIDGVKVQ